MAKSKSIPAVPKVFAQKAYGDPLKVLIKKEEQTCKGCQYAFIAWDRRACGMGMRYGDRCHNYAEREEDAMPKLERRDLDSVIVETPYKRLMDIWQRWVSLSDRQCSDGDANLQDTKDFMRAGEAVETMINDLPRYQWWAIRKARGISTVWLFQNLNLLDALADAEKNLTPKMRQHIATRRFFD
jgi:hypothetical protein